MSVFLSGSVSCDRQPVQGAPRLEIKQAVYVVLSFFFSSSFQCTHFLWVLSFFVEFTGLYLGEVSAVSFL